MPSTYELKARFSRLLMPCVRRLVAAGVTANGVTWAALVLSVAYGAAIHLWPATPILFLLFPLVLLVRMALNNIDGVVAREFDQQTALGGYLNELGDVVSDLALYVPFAGVAGFRADVVLAFALLGTVAEFAGVLAHARGLPRSYRGPVTKSDRALVMGLLGFALYLGLDAPLVLNGVLGAAALLSLVTVRNRVRAGTGEAGDA